MDANELREAAERGLEGSDCYVVDCTAGTGGDFELVIDSDTYVDIERCATLNRALNDAFPDEDFSLTVASAGIGQPLRLLRQYRRLVGRPLDVLLASGTRILGHLESVDEQGITLRYEERVAVEGSKRRRTEEVSRTYPFEALKWAREWLDYK